MSCGTPVVVTDVGGLNEVVGDVGVKAKVDGIRAATDAICSLLEDKALWIEFSEAARSRILSKFTLTHRKKG